jgi:3-phenylpropionate/trans-cinnamate dioxygenase ferredoxin reductase component
VSRHGDDVAAVIVGAGLTGGNVAVALRENGHRGPIVVIGDEGELPFGRPPLSKTYLRGEETLDGWLVRPAEWYTRNDVELRHERVSSIDTTGKHVALASGEFLPYGALVLCTGGRARRPAVPGVDLPGVHLLRTVADCHGLQRAARDGKRAAVVGMGFIGSEVAASLTQMGVRVTAIFTGSAPMETALGAEVGAAMAAMHREHGVELLPDDPVASFDGTDAVRAVVTKRGTRVDCDFAVVGAGIEPNVEVAANANIAVDNGILVDAHCRTNVDGVFAAGDVANHVHPLFGRVRVEHYNNAEKMGAAVGRVILGDPAPYDYIHTFWSDQYDDKLEYAGHATAWDDFVVRGSVADRAFIGFYLRAGTLIAAVGLNRGGDPELDAGSEMAVARDLIAARATPPRSALADERSELRDVLAPSRRS